MIFSSCGKYLFIAGNQLREILVVDVTVEEEINEPLTSIPMKSVTQSMNIKAKSKRAFDILCLFDAGASILRFDANELNSISVKSIDPNLNFCASTFSKVHHKAIFIERCSSQLKHHCVDFEDAEGEFIATNYEAPSVQIHPKSLQSSKESEISVLGPLESGAVRRPLIEESNGVSKRARVESNQTLEERLEHLSRSMQELEGKVDPDPEATPAADSLVTLIDQALQSGDDALLEQCLSYGDLAVIETTAESLPSGRVLLLMKRLVAKFEKRPSRGILLTRWLSAILRHHMSLLVSMPDVSAQLAGLSQMLELRLASYSRLAALGGRLDLLLAQGRSRRLDTQQAPVPKTTFIDN